MKVKFTLNMINLVVDDKPINKITFSWVSDLSQRLPLAGSQICPRRRYCPCPGSGLRIRTF